MSNRLQEHLIRAGKDLGITVVAPFVLRLSSGRAFTGEVLLPELGAPKGTIVCRSCEAYLEFHEELKSEGYTCSSFGEPPLDEEYDMESYKDMFSDWGWVSNERKPPAWMD